MKYDYMIKTFLVFIFMAGLFLTSCKRVTDGLDNTAGFVELNIDSSAVIQDVNWETAPYHTTYAYNLSTPYLADSNGVIMIERKNEFYYHPVVLANLTIICIGSYGINPNPEYISRSILFINKLLEDALETGGALYFPYTFDFNLHRIEGEDLIAPWYSGMAQGQGLSALVRLYRSTDDEKYLNAAQKVFKSFKRIGQNLNPWTVLSDSSNYYWIEEYPLPIPSHVLNGFIWGIFGLYDYYELTRDEEAYKYLLASITTLKHFLPQWRRPQNLSIYCLKHKAVDPHYHLVHTKQLNNMFAITGDPFFKAMADSFYQDYH